MKGEPAFCVCVPARNEGRRLPVLLAALAAQDLPGRISVALCINNSTDGSLHQAQAAADRWKDRLDIVVDLQTFPEHRAHAGAARRAAMSAGLEHLGDRSNGVLISTDADTRPPPNWLSANLACIASGADLVGGRLVLDEAEAISADVAALRRLWDAYWREVRAIEDEIDPSPHDPAPRHGDHTGASLAITAAAYRSAGGVPEQPTGEDRALVIAAQAQGARLVHPLAVWTRVSARTTGRAAGGMAEDMSRLFDQARNGGPIMAPDFSHWRQRASWRRDQRHDAASARRLSALETQLPAMPLDMDLREWADGIERAAA
ncbi:glycosyltransferase [Brevundimonas vesicularis]|uniref:glycosyltransferase n=1 Tax=Brevundimonas vesicularis TaxID=41276 RepID=UPI0028B156A1|nr:glycosyltransferase [Brevundimonas vesicularis]